MIYVTGDCHGNYARFNRKYFSPRTEMSKDDYVIICGDFGLWDTSKEQKYWLDWLENLPFTLLWVDGNHENFDLVETYPIEEWHGGKVQFIRPSVVHLMRGQVYELQGKKFFTFGGAQSHDIAGGIVEKDDIEGRRHCEAAYQFGGIPYRVNHESWWEQELPSESELEEGRRNLEKHSWKVDYIISHCAALSSQSLLLVKNEEPNRLTLFFEEIKERCTFSHWYFGHYHRDGQINDRETVVYCEKIRIE